jgi:hypothetical protein
MQRIYQNRRRQEKEKARQQEPGRTKQKPSKLVRLAMIVVVVPVSAMAPLARFFQVVAAGLRLTAVFTVLALGIVQSALRVADSLLALSVVIVVAVQRPRGNRSAQERTDHKGRNECSGFFKHPCLLQLPLHPTLDWKGRKWQSQVHEFA